MDQKETQREKTDKIISNFQHSFMSNTKWVKLIGFLVENADLIKSTRLKLVWDIGTRDFLFDEYSQFEVDYYHNSVEAMVSGVPRGFYDYKEFEWLEVPKVCSVLKNPDNLKAGTVEFSHDLDKIYGHLVKVESFETIKCHDYLRIIAYR